MDQDTPATPPTPPAPATPPANSKARWARFLYHVSSRELWSAVLMSLATVTSAWCAYQAAVWSGIQAMSLAHANTLNRRAMTLILEGGQQRVMNVNLFLQYLAAVSRGDTRLADFLVRHFPPSLKKTFGPWLAADPFKNPDAPSHPFILDEYTLPHDAEARRLIAQSDAGFTRAEEAKRHSDKYVLLTVICASVLFFGGIATKFPSTHIQIIVLVIGFLLWFGCVVLLAKLPVAGT